jgi:hypothetical protein
MPNETAAAFAAAPPTYDFDTQYGVNPVWMYIIVGTDPGRNIPPDNVYQFVPTSNPSGYHTVDTNSGNWQQMNWATGDGFGPMMTPGDIATANPGAEVYRAYLSLGMGNSYHTGGASGVLANGTVAWVDTATVGGVTYDFAVANEGTSNVLGAIAAPTISMVAPSNITFPQFTFGVASIQETAGFGTVTVVPGSATNVFWSVTAADVGPGSAWGYMKLGGTGAALTNPLYISATNSGWVPAATGYTVNGENNITNLDFWGDQTAVVGDAAGSYSTTVTFTVAMVMSRGLCEITID